MNRYSKALKHIKSTQIEEKIKKLEESTPTNNTDNLYSTNPQGFNDGPPDPAKAFYPDQDGDWPSGIPGDEDAASYLRPPGFWTGEVNWDTIHTANVSQDEIGSDGKSTAGVIADDGTVKTILPENTRDFILCNNQIESLMHTRKNSLTLLDISTPRNIDPSIRDIVNVDLFDLDHLHNTYIAEVYNDSESLEEAEKRIVELSKDMIDFLDSSYARRKELVYKEETH